MTKVEEVIITDLTRRGNGKELLSPMRPIIEIYSKEGYLIALHDSQGNFSLEDMIAFGVYCKTFPEKTMEDAFNDWKKCYKSRF
jgi:hypothetical protein